MAWLWHLIVSLFDWLTGMFNGKENSVGITKNVQRKAVEIRYDKGSGEGEVYLEGLEGETWERKLAGPDDGLFEVTYGNDFSGESSLRVVDGDGNVLSEGTITVE
jgi:hypothetical protein